MAEFEFEDILPFVEGEGDTGRTAREKFKRNFDKIKPLGEIPAEVQQVKREVNELNKELQESLYAPNEEITSSGIEEYKAIRPDGSIATLSAVGYVVAEFGVDANTVYHIEYNTYQLGSNVRAWGAFYDENDVPLEILGILKTSSDETEDTDKHFAKTVKSPLSSVKLRLGYSNYGNTVSKVYSTRKGNVAEIVEQVNSLTNTTTLISEQVELIKDKTSAVEAKINANTVIKDTIIVADETIERAAIKGSGSDIGGVATNLSGAGYTVDVYDVQPSTVYYIDYKTAQVGANVRLWGAVYDDNDVMIESLGQLPTQNDSYTPDDLIHRLYYKTPANAAVIKLGYHNGGGTVTSSIYTTEDLNIPEKIEEFEEAIGSGGHDVISQAIITNPKIDLRKPELKVLHIGNSFMAGATGYLSQFISAAGIDVSDMCMYLLNRSSGSFKSWYNVYHDSDTTTYSISKCFGGISPTGIPTSYTTYQPGDGSGFRNMLTLVKWDLIVIQQASTYSNSHNGWEGNDSAGYLRELLRIIRTYQPQATIGFHLCHASPKQSPNGSPTVAGDTQARHAEIVEATKWISSRYGIDFIVPYGTAIENLRTSSLNTTSNKFTYDNHHLADGLAQYVANATYFQALLAPRYGISVLGNSFRKTVTSSELSKYTVNQDNAIDVTDSNYYEAQMCAILAVNDMYDVVNPDGVNL